MAGRTTNCCILHLYNSSDVSYKLLPEKLHWCTPQSFIASSSPLRHATYTNSSFLEKSISGYISAPCVQQTPPFTAPQRCIVYPSCHAWCILLKSWLVRYPWKLQRFLIAPCVIQNPPRTAPWCTRGSCNVSSPPLCHASNKLLPFGHSLFTPRSCALLPLSAMRPTNSSPTFWLHPSKLHLFLVFMLVLISGLDFLMTNVHRHSIPFICSC